jgi:hypothetical protein
MTDILRKYLLSSVAFSAPDDGSGAPDGDDRIEVDPEDDEDPGDGDNADDQGDNEDDEGQDDDSQDAAGGGERQPGRRGDQQFGALRDTNRTLAEENARLARELEETRRRASQAPPQQHQQPQETAEQRAARLAALSPEDRILTIMREDREADRREQQFYRYQDALRSDKAAFDAKCAANPLAKKFAGEVEKQFLQWQSQGQFVARDILLKTIIGDKALEQAGKPRKASEGRRRNEVRAPNTRPDVRPSRGRAAAGSASDIEERFGDVPI